VYKKYDVQHAPITINPANIREAARDMNFEIAPSGRGWRPTHLEFLFLPLEIFVFKNNDILIVQIIFFNL